MDKKRTLALFIASSLDGYIATKDENLDWLFTVEGLGDNGYSDFYNTIDTVLMGRTTYDWIMKYTPGGYPYKDKVNYVFSRKEHPNTEAVTFIKDDIITFITDLKLQDGGKIWIVGGGEIVSYFLEHALIDEIFITIAPRIIGEGRPLFVPAKYTLDLTLQGTKTFNQFVEFHYTLNK